MNLKLAFLTLIISAGLLSCKKDEETPSLASADLQVSQDENRAQYEVEDVSSIQDEIMSLTGVSFGRQAATTDTSFTWESCAQVTIVPKGNNSTGKVTVDFGTGCTGPDGRTRKGKIEWTYTARLREPGAVIVTRFMDYGVRNSNSETFVMVDNASTKTTTNENTMPASATNPVLNLKREVSMKLIFSDNTQISWSGTRNVNWELGVLGNRWDNIYTVKSGSSVSGTDRNGRAFTATVLTDVVRKAECALLGIYKPVSGVLEITRQGGNLVLDYGNGTCDRTVTITRNGRVFNTRW
jgi:hypothetical protein